MYSKNEGRKRCTGWTGVKMRGEKKKMYCVVGGKSKKLDNVYKITQLNRIYFHVRRSA
jgi:hypothetical protein